MKWVGEGSGTIYVSVGDYIDKNDVYKVLDRGAVVSIAPYARRIDLVSIRYTYMILICPLYIHFYVVYSHYKSTAFFFS